MRAHESARLLGKLGGKARARRLPAEERQRIASLGGAARRESLAAARRIADNFIYAATVVALRGGPVPVARVSECEGPLPDLRRRQPST